MCVLFGIWATVQSVYSTRLHRDMEAHMRYIEAQNTTRREFKRNSISVGCLHHKKKHNNLGNATQEETIAFEYTVFI